MAPDDHNRLGALPREMTCPSCSHTVHGLLHCGADLDVGVLCPCRCPVPGDY
jgi:hypothetical protein